MFVGFDELPLADQPPKRIWLKEERLNAWFAEVKRRQRDESGPNAIEDPVQNYAAKDLIVG